jgi:hypothetical protein
MTLQKYLTQVLDLRHSYGQKRYSISRLWTSRWVVRRGSALVPFLNSLDLYFILLPPLPGTTCCRSHVGDRN